MSDLFRCHLVNAPGCGRTSPPAEISGYDLPGIIGFFDDVRERLGLDRVTVMGHSWGGLVAAAWAAARPDSVERLVVIDGYPGSIDAWGSAADREAARAEQERVYARHGGEPWFDAAERALGEEESGVELDEQTWISNFYPAWPMYFSYPDSPLVAPHVARIMAEVRMNMAINYAWFGDAHHFDDIDILPSLAGVNCPSLVIAGQDDFICGPAWNRPIAAAIPGARYVEFADTGHLPHYEQPDPFRAALVDWLAAT